VRTNAFRATARTVLGVGLALLVGTAFFACTKNSGDDDDADANGTDSGNFSTTDAADLPDIIFKRETGTPTKCAIYQGSTTNESCSCGEDSSPFTGAPTDTCPISANPNYCVAYDVSTPMPAHRQCTCQPKCLFQHVSGGGEGGGGVDTCRCGVSSHLVLGGDGSKDESKPTCEGYSVCCKDTTGCDCTNDSSYACPGTSTKVASCTPDDFNTTSWREAVYGDPIYSNLVDVDKCQ